ncbi:MAG TPA: single-stranded-DNA-specific exonuclease RecJ [Alphaproteobacteria bacterium]|nr:single-stranded-DNA-specific exonuclease RecJ [Alphaproteobacteria bacterium]
MFDDALSLLGKKWVYQKADENQVEFLVQRLGLPYAVCRVLALRGVKAESAELFLDPKLQTLMPNPSCLNDMDKTAAFLADVIEKKEKVGIIGDYDVDGATSSALLRRFLEFFGVSVAVHIPERDEGYGPSKKAFDEFEFQGIKNVVTTDCGTTAFDVLGEAATRGFKIVVLDHHEAETKLPDVLAVVNPKRLDEQNDYPYLKYMAAVGVVFLTLVAVNRELKNRGFYEKHEKPDLMRELDLVALGTVCDVVPLLGLNRAYVKQGLKVISNRTNLGLTTLIDNSGISQRPTVYHLGFVLGPRINAGGRVGDSSIGHKLLCTSSPSEALELSQKLNGFNAERKDIEAHVLSEALEQLEGCPQKYPMAFVYGKTWHQGVIGIVAGKLKERYNLPSFVMSVEADEVKGSARSISGLDLGALIMTAKEKGILTKGGGHMMAAGFSLNEDRIEDFRKFVGEYIKEKLPDEALMPTIDFDAVLDLGGANLDLAEKLEILAPFGANNPEPKIVIENVKIIKPMIVGEDHVKCLLSNGRSNALKAICFKCADNEVGNALLNSKDGKFDVLGTLRVDSFMNNKNIQLTIEDMKRIEND